MIGPRSLQARIHRLAELSCALAKEEITISEARDTLLYLERRAYLVAVQNAISALGDARVTLATACQRLTEGEAA